MEHQELKRGLKNRHIQLIALGGAIGTGLFYGSAATIQLVGPAVMLSYAIGGFFIYLVMRCMGEMSVHTPVSGAFSTFAYKYWGEMAGFVSGWNYWFCYIAVSMAEVTAVGIYVNYWFPDIPQWVAGFIMFLVITGINLIGVKAFGEIEFWGAIIKGPCGNCDDSSRSCHYPVWFWSRRRTCRIFKFSCRRRIYAHGYNRITVIPGSSHICLWRG